MPDIFYLFSKWWKQILSVVVITLVGAGIILYSRPSKYLSVATALPASSFATDKASVFNQNIQSLYAALGTPDDLDVIVGTAQLDTPYIAVAEKFDVAGHYKVEEQGQAAKLKAAYLLKASTKVIKSEYNELKVKVWDADKDFAAQMANGIIEKLQDIHGDLQNSNNITLLNNLQSGKQKLQIQADSISQFLKSSDISNLNTTLYTTQLNNLSAQLEQFGKLINEYQLMADSKPQVLMIVERARAANWPDKPKRIPALIATFALSLLFALGVALLLERRKTITR